MRDYAQEGIQHFYFMMLQKDEVGCSRLLLLNTLSIFASLSMQRKVVALVDSQIIAAIPTALSLNGQLVTKCEWGSLLSG